MSFGDSTGRCAGPALTVVPPGVVTTQIDLDIRVAIPPQQTPSTARLEHLGDVSTNLASWSIGPSPEWTVHTVRTPAAPFVGTGDLRVTVTGTGESTEVRRRVRVVDAAQRSPGVLGGAWVDLYHHDEREGRPFNDDLRQLTAQDWRLLVEAMAAVGQETLVVTMVFQNFTHRTQHAFDATSYPGAAYYPSALYPARMPIATPDPIQVILDAADELDLSVLLGIGTYAFFDYTAESSRWSVNVLRELTARYAQHRSLYGWYVSHEQCGGLFTPGLGDPEEQRTEMVQYFNTLRREVDQLTPGKPIMLATNPFGLDGAERAYEQVLPCIDILAPFGFHRMPEGDLSGADAAVTLDEWCRAAGTHLWLDIESFAWPLRDGYELHPRAIDAIVADLATYTSFEKVLHYQFPGLMAPKGLASTPGGAPAMALYDSYAAYYRDWSLRCLT